ncbi:hypothetical protein [Virgibacillus salexigens]|uniref:hypothetical protein n=1 Tax=Virgibacillus salexigens TaxID=61016 RepID=UPI00190D209F|nr:hypothetical protein [Virgibacillus salexigens]
MRRLLEPYKLAITYLWEVIKCTPKYIKKTPEAISYTVKDTWASIVQLFSRA